jgi:hypothetical protein
MEPAAYAADTFPAGLAAFHEEVGSDKTIWTHNGRWVGASPYRSTCLQQTTAVADGQQWLMDGGG